MSLRPPSPTKIFKHVYLGSDKDARNLKDLKHKGIKSKLSVSIIEDEDLIEYFEDASEYITIATSDGSSKVLVHCETGASDSAAVVIAYAMKAYGWDLSLARIHVKITRDCIELNSSLLKQLLRYESKLEATRNEREQTLMIGIDNCNDEESSDNQFEMRSDQSTYLEIINDTLPIDPLLLPHEITVESEHSLVVCENLSLSSISQTFRTSRQESSSMPCQSYQSSYEKFIKQNINGGSIIETSKTIEIIDLTSDKAIDEDPVVLLYDNSQEQQRCIVRPIGSRSSVDSEQLIEVTSDTLNRLPPVSSPQVIYRRKSHPKAKKSCKNVSANRPAASNRAKYKEMNFEVSMKNKQDKRRWLVKIRKQPYRKARTVAYFRLLFETHDKNPSSFNAKVHRQLTSVKQTDRASFTKTWKQDKKCSRTRVVTYSGLLQSTNLAATGASSATHPRKILEAANDNSLHSGNPTATTTAKAKNSRKVDKRIKINDKFAAKLKYSLRSREILVTDTGSVANANEIDITPSSGTSETSSAILSDAETQTPSAWNAQIACCSEDENADESPAASEISNEDERDNLNSVIGDLVEKLFPTPDSCNSNSSSQTFKIALNSGYSIRRTISNIREKETSATSDDSPWRYSSKPSVDNQQLERNLLHGRDMPVKDQAIQMSFAPGRCIKPANATTSVAGVAVASSSLLVSTMEATHSTIAGTSKRESPQRSSMKRKTVVTSMKAQLKKEASTFSCACGKSYKHESSYYYHKKYCGKDSRFICTCGKTYKHQSTYTKHKKYCG